MMKFLRYSILVAVLCPFGSMHAQSDGPMNLPKYDQVPLHFGMALGLNSMDFTIHNSGPFLTARIDSIYSISNKPRTGFNINIVSNLNLHKYFAVRFLPGLNFGQRDLTYWVRKDSSYYAHTMKLESTYLDFPILIKYSGKRLTNFRPYLLAGTSFKIDLAAQKKIKEEERPKIRLSRMSWYYEVGFGTDFFLEYFKFALELKYVVGINNVLVPDPTQYSSAIERMNSKMIILSFLFEGSDIRVLRFGKRTSGG
jgi:hypothetical protein